MLSESHLATHTNQVIDQSSVTYPLLIFQSMGNWLSLLRLAGLRHRFHFLRIKISFLRQRCLQIHRGTKSPGQKRCIHPARCSSCQPLQRPSCLCNIHLGTPLTTAALAMRAAAAGILRPGTWGFTLGLRFSFCKPKEPIWAKVSPYLGACAALLPPECLFFTVSLAQIIYMSITM